MTDEQAGKFIKVIYEYQKTGEVSELDFAMSMAFTPFKNQFLRDGVKWEKKSNINKINGSKGGKAKSSERKRTLANGSVRKRSLANVAVSVNDSVSVNVNASVSESKKKILFALSPFFDKAKFAEALTGWSKAKINHYYDAADSWSAEGNKKIDWIKTVKNWASRDESEGKKFVADSELNNFTFI